MKGKILVASLLLLPVLAHAGQTQRNEFLGVQESQTQTIVDVKVDCRGRYELTPEMNIELLTKVNNKLEKYKAALVSTGYPEIEITVSRNGNEVCRYLTKSNISAFNGVMSLKIIDKMSLNEKFCEGMIGKDFEFRPSSVDKNLQYYAPMRDLTNKCSLTGKFGDATREYMNRGLLKAGPVPEEITFTGILKGIFK